MSGIEGTAARIADQPTSAHPEWIMLMFAMLTDMWFADPGWTFERRHDGVPLRVFRDGDRTRLMTPDRNEVNDTYRD
ncbi:hypothetical protein N5A93_12460 [Roseovarius sp. EGI FJ00037]|uniref:hypothetical protein n=1 Tax=Roseovarius TaxID=74030 RepID=UPI0022A86FE3|nr:hypothetical protein [Roseovarius sp. EGI FJ00037]MCZ0813049.1 hypothetical protein [Roseovarius sp. EGI FJ00037]